MVKILQYVTTYPIEQMKIECDDITIKNDINNNTTKNNITINKPDYDLYRNIYINLKPSTITPATLVPVPGVVAGIVPTIQQIEDSNINAAISLVTTASNAEKLFLDANKTTPPTTQAQIQLLETASVNAYNNIINNSINIISNLHNTPEPITDHEYKLISIYKHTFELFQKTLPFAIPIPDIKKFLKDYVLFNILFEELLKYNINVLHTKLTKIKERTVIIIPTHEGASNGIDKLDTLFLPVYEKIFGKISPELQITQTNPVIYYRFNVFPETTMNNEEYKIFIKQNFDKLKREIIEYNDKVSRTPIRNGENQLSTIENVIFIIDRDKKTPFSDFFTSLLPKDKKEILYNEYKSFLSSKFIVSSVKDTSITMTSNDIKKKMNEFEKRTFIKLSYKKSDWDNLFTCLKEGYLLVVDKNYKKSLEVTDDIKTMYIYYRTNNIDTEIINDKIKTGTANIYTLEIDLPNNNNIIIHGYFTVISEPIKKYKFKESTRHFNIRQKKINTFTPTTPTPVTTPAPTPTPATTTDSDSDDDEDTMPSGKEKEIEFILTLLYEWSVFKYKVLSPNVTFQYIDVNPTAGGQTAIKEFTFDTNTKYKITEKDQPTNKKYKFFTPHDIDLSLPTKQGIKYYDNILFDKKTLIGYLTKNKKYNEKTNLSYEFLKINSSPELITFCEYIYLNFKDHTKGIQGMLNFGMFDFIKFNEKDIKKNIIDLIFQPNTAIYLQNQSKTTNEQRTTDTKNSYKIIDYIYNLWSYDYRKQKIADIEEENYYPKTAAKDIKTVMKIKRDRIINGTDIPPNEQLLVKTDREKEEAEDIEKLKQLSMVIVSVTTENIADVKELKKKGYCKSKTKKIDYDYQIIKKQFLKRIGEGIGKLVVGGSNINRTRNRSVRTRHRKRRKTMRNK